MKKIFIAAVIFFVLALKIPAFAEEPKVLAKGALLMDYDTGRVLWSKTADEPLAMASTTKIMTAIITLESGKLNEEAVVSKKAASAPDVQLGLKTGDKVLVKDLLYPLMLESSNDAAIVIAEHIGGSVEDFCAGMTEKAQEIGAYDTAFETPNGLDTENHHSTAYDMALITRYALRNEEFRKVISTPEATIKTSEGKSYYVTNKNRLLREFSGAIGVKTGFTGNAGHCFIGAAERDDITLIAVALGSGWGAAGKTQKWKDVKSMLEFGFKEYHLLGIGEKGRVIKTLDVLKSKKGKVTVMLENDLCTILTEEEKELISCRVTLPKEVYAPIEKGMVLGSIEIYLPDGEILAESQLIAANNVYRHDFFTSLHKVLYNWINISEYDIGFDVFK